MARRSSALRLVELLMLSPDDTEQVGHFKIESFENLSFRFPVALQHGPTCSRKRKVPTESLLRHRASRASFACGSSAAERPVRVSAVIVGRLSPVFVSASSRSTPTNLAARAQHGVDVVSASRRATYSRRYSQFMKLHSQQIGCAVPRVFERRHSENQSFEIKVISGGAVGSNRIDGIGESSHGNRSK